MLFVFFPPAAHLLDFLRRNRYRLVTAEAFSHIDHAALAFRVAFLELLTFGGQGLGEGWSKTVGRGVAVDHYAVAALETEGKGVANIFAG